MLSATNVTVKYGDGDAALDRVKISVVPGTITALIGPSGSGKTTLLKVLSFLEHPAGGQIDYEGASYVFPLRQNAGPAPWPKITVVFQQLFLWPHLTLRQNILLGLTTRKDDPQSRKRLTELIELLDMRDFVNRYPNQASLGERQRAALARALVLEPKYLLLDEITSALDVEHVASVLQHLQVLRDRGVGILLVTHLLRFARRVASKVVFLDVGKVIESGGPEVLDNPASERVRRFVSVVEAAS